VAGFCDSGDEPIGPIRVSVSVSVSVAPHSLNLGTRQVVIPRPGCSSPGRKGPPVPISLSVRGGLVSVGKRKISILAVNRTLIPRSSSMQPSQHTGCDRIGRQCHLPEAHAITQIPTVIECQGDFVRPKFLGSII
jgi:hypothetical protein